MKRLLWPAALLSVLALTACGRNDDNGTSNSSTPSNDFLLFPNSHASIGVGDYTVRLTGPALVTTAISYTLTVRFTDGRVETYSGTWTSNNEVDLISIVARHAGGITLSLSSGGALALIELRVGSSTFNIAVSNNGASQVNPSIDLPRFQIDQSLYAQKYYETVDPLSAKTTLSTWKTSNSFSGQNCNPGTVGTVTEYEVRFHDQRDLGYGRHLCVRRDSATGDIAAWVENFQVTAIPGQDYGPLNLEAVVNDDRRWHIGTNAIEYSATPSSGGVKFVKFYTFNPDGTRRLLVDLDGKGAKAMPIPCISCHGGTAWPLQTVWNSGTSSTDLVFPSVVGFPRADARAQMQPLNVNSLGFSPIAGFRRQDQEASLKGINQMLLCTYPLPVGGSGSGTEDACRTATTKYADWQGTAAEMVKAWYGGNGMPCLTAGDPCQAAIDAYVPTGWTNGQTAPISGETVPSTPDATNLYRTVVAGNCRVCHALRGNSNNALGITTGSNDIDFMEYQKFIGGTTYAGYASRIRHHVFERGNMPLALLKYEQFWESGAPMTLAALIAGALDGNGNVLTPTRPIADPGPDRTLVTNAPSKLSAAQSVNATSYRWRITSQPVGSTATLDGAATSTSIRPSFVANMNGPYQVELVANNGSTSSAPATLRLETVSSLQDDPTSPLPALSGIANNPAAITFTHVRAILQDNTIYFCTSCHTGPTTDGPPIHYNDYDRVGIGGGATGTETANRHQLYLDVRARVNFTDIASSRILQRPSGNHHPGGLITNFDASLAPGTNGRGAYDIVLHWILNGAPE